MLHHIILLISITSHIRKKQLQLRLVRHYVHMLNMEHLEQELSLMQLIRREILTMMRSTEIIILIMDSTMLRIHTCHRYRIISMSSHLRDIQLSMRISLQHLTSLILRRLIHPQRTSLSIMQRA